mmetsp:Transcript_53175/g.146874  ORF Transcript_53175/g.146874 Transcript_53175/m.146874 type:complete len:207 (+) Transcript_53175:1502-2122(+)
MPPSIWWARYTRPANVRHFLSSSSCMSPSRHESSSRDCVAGVESSRATTLAALSTSCASMAKHASGPHIHRTCACLRTICVNIGWLPKRAASCSDVSRLSGVTVASAVVCRGSASSFRGKWNDLPPSPSSSPSPSPSPEVPSLPFGSVRKSYISVCPATTAAWSGKKPDVPQGRKLRSRLSCGSVTIIQTARRKPNAAAYPSTLEP